MLLPKRVKFRKQHRGRMTGKAMRGNTVSHGEYGLQALQPAWITSNQIEAARSLPPLSAYSFSLRTIVTCDVLLRILYALPCALGMILFIIGPGQT